MADLDAGNTWEKWSLFWVSFWWLRDRMWMVFSSGQRKDKGPGFTSCYSTMNPDWLSWVCSQMPLSTSQFTTEWGESGLSHTVCTPPILRLAGGRFNPWCNSEQPQGCSGLCCFLTVPLGLPYLGMHLTWVEAGGKGDRNHCIELPTDTHTIKIQLEVVPFQTSAWKCIYWQRWKKVLRTRLYGWPHIGFFFKVLFYEVQTNLVVPWVWCFTQILGVSLSYELACSHGKYMTIPTLCLCNHFINFSSKRKNFLGHLSLLHYLVSYSMC